jgi:crotonobetaine/carnitine-CoA ligase
VVHADLHQRLGEIELKSLREIVVLGGEARPAPGLIVRGGEALDCADVDPPALEREIAPWDLQSIFFTSGATGPSKGVLSSYVHLYNIAIAAPFLSGDDRYMLNLPLFHSGGVMPTTDMLIHGGLNAMVDAFNTDAFWDTVRSRKITTSILLGVMGGFLLKRPASPDDRNHPCAPTPTSRSIKPHGSSKNGSARTSTRIST